jgi:ElaB/YqjD/DUF883 family membrane-anchored ribosome-binding protein
LHHAIVTTTRLPIKTKETEEEHTMPNKTSLGSSPTTADVGTVARDMAEGARNAAASMTDGVRGAAATLDESRSTAADGLDVAASALQDRAADLPGGETVRNVARAAADGLGSSAEYVRTHDAKRMMADVESLVKSNPGPALAVAAAFGFLLGRALSRD